MSFLNFLVISSRLFAYVIVRPVLGVFLVESEVSD